jgi:CelD/BcsL family acetyltransferase involved in cellulose biosynthesis
MGGAISTALAARSAEVHLVKDLDSIKTIRDIWLSLRIDDIDADPDFFAAVVRSSPAVTQPYVVLIDRVDDSPLVAVARLETKQLPILLGYRRLPSPSVRALVVCFGGLLGDIDRAAAAQLLDELERPLRDDRVDVVVMPKLDTASAVHEVARQSIPSHRRGQSTESSRWVAKVPATLEDFLSGRSRKTRQTYRRQDRRLEEKFGSALRIQVYGKNCDANRAIDDMREVAIKTYQHGLGVSLSDSGLEIAMIREGFAQGWFRAWVLYINDCPVAFWSGTTYRGTFSTGTPGFDPEYARDSVGRYTMFKMVDDLCRDSEVQILDFGHGEAEYKEAFGERVRSEADLIIYAPRIVPLLINSATSAVEYINRLGHALVSRNDWARELKRRWRASHASSPVTGVPINER